MKNLHQQVLELLPQCIEDRRWLHRHAELSFREYKTADYLEQALCEYLGVEQRRRQGNCLGGLGRQHSYRSETR